MLLNLRDLYRRGIGDSLTKSAQAIVEASRAPNDAEWDVFLSHSSVDKRALPAVVERLRLEGLSVYVDSVADSDLTPANVNQATAIRLRGRILHCRSLFVLTSQSITASRWIPWELGVADGAGKRVAVLPLQYGEDRDGYYRGAEYLGLYPYIDEARQRSGNGPFLWANDPRDQNIYRILEDWLEGWPLKDYTRRD